MVTQKKKTFKEKEIISKKHFDAYPKKERLKFEVNQWSPIRTMLTHNK
jgi:hypothetical protein